MIEKLTNIHIYIICVCIQKILIKDKKAINVSGCMEKPGGRIPEMC